MITPPGGWYHSVAGVVCTGGQGLVACYRLSDGHCASFTAIMVARSEDGGRTWSAPERISCLSVEGDGAVWVAPQISRLRSGRIMLICDRGQRAPGQSWPMLSQWQKAHRGMSNHLFWSDDGGRNWSGPQQVDTVGGEPSYVVELDDGTLLYTRTDSAETTLLQNPPMPWGCVYYRSSVVFCDDGAKTWGRTALLSDDPFHGDCEVAVADLGAGELIAISRIGMGGSFYGQPSRIFRSHDGGRTWSAPVLSPVYAHRPCLRKLDSGNLLVTYRNAPGTPGNYALVFSAEETLPYEPQSWLPEERRCKLADGELHIRTGEGKEAAAGFIFYPAIDVASRVEVVVTLRVESADLNGCNVSAGCWIRFMPGRVCLADRPAEGFAMDTGNWHTYRIIREDSGIRIYVDDTLMLYTAIDAEHVRSVHVGNRVGGGEGLALWPQKDLVDSYRHNASDTAWKQMYIRVDNPGAHSVLWQWDARSGTFPDQFRRDRLVLLDRSFSFADTGYGGWAEAADGTVTIVDYTTGDASAGRSPFIRSYLTSEAELRR